MEEIPGDASAPDSGILETQAEQGKFRLLFTFYMKWWNFVVLPNDIQFRQLEEQRRDDEREALLYWEPRLKKAAAQKRD